ncbi:uncharacterized protein LOC125216633 [Salvia hispanica]|uniref:uncharacterized protein LOC125216633 n=1 Tax=Salvia hispanica TaxID=49212 RepID=UPI002009703E|nr:uncharacterized protein LOC125216633 [Salvia hispanica]XP_047974347.1 uncharacterized protein LOC125216633 [Salvia hispanica]XP_047974348.1 uncharacterized protein LOC125216633 [Salvia hispanica]
MMLVSCTAAAGAYLEGYARRPRGRTIPAPIVLAGAFVISVSGRASSGMIVAGYPSPNTVGLVLLSVAAYVLLEMAKPGLRIYRIFSFYWAYLPVITGILHDGWDYPYLTHPAMLALPAIFQIVAFKMMVAMLEALAK